MNQFYFRIICIVFANLTIFVSALNHTQNTEIRGAYNESHLSNFPRNESQILPQPGETRSRDVEIRESYVKSPVKVLYYVRTSLKVTLGENASAYNHEDEIYRALQVLYTNISGIEDIYIRSLRGDLIADYVAVFGRQKTLEYLPKVIDVIEEVRMPLKKAMETLEVFGSNIDLPFSYLRLDVGLAELQHMLLNPYCETNVVNVTCSYGYRCGIRDNDYVCLHKCVDKTCSVHGVCTLTSEWLPTCRCVESAEFVYSGDECEVEIPKIGFSKEQLYTIGVGVTGTLLFTMFVITCCLCKSRKRAQQKANQPGRPSEMLRNLFNFDGLDLPNASGPIPAGAVPNMAGPDMCRRMSVLNPPDVSRRMSYMGPPDLVPPMTGTQRRISLMSNPDAYRMAWGNSSLAQPRMSVVSLTPPPPYHEEQVPCANLQQANTSQMPSVPVDDFVKNAVSVAVRTALEDVTHQIVNPLRSRLQERETELQTLRRSSVHSIDLAAPTDTILTSF